MYDLIIKNGTLVTPSADTRIVHRRSIVEAPANREELTFVQADDLDRSFKVIPEINRDECVGCGRCVASM